MKFNKFSITKQYKPDQGFFSHRK